MYDIDDIVEFVCPHKDQKRYFLNVFLLVCIFVIDLHL